MACQHRSESILQCSKPTICVPTPYIKTCYHPAECPDCLGMNFWPEASYTTTEIVRNGGSADVNLHAKAQAQSLLDFVVYWLSDQYSLWDETGQGLLMTATEATKHEEFVLWVYYEETYCAHCLSRPAFGEHCQTCDASPTTQNIVRNYRKQRVQQLNLANFTNHERAIEEITASHVRQDFQHMDNIYTWPHSNDRVKRRHSMATSKMRSYMYQRLDESQARPRGEEELYRLFGLQILTAASSLMAFDTGLVDENIKDVMRYLAQILPHPDDRTQYSWSHKPSLSLTAYRRVATACMRQNGQAFITKMARVNEALLQDLEGIRTRQLMAMNARKSDMVVARLQH